MNIFDKKELIKKELLKHNVLITDMQARQFLEYYDLLLEWNSFMNLTGITEFREVVIKHFADSLALSRVTDLNHDISVIDVGTGAGFPGIPLKIAFPSIKITLLDSLNKRIKFLDEVIKHLNLKDIFAIHGRAEDYGKNRTDSFYRESFDICVSRAVANISVLSEYCLPFVKMNGLFVAYKSERLSEETEEGYEAISVLGGNIEDKVSFTLDDGKIYRSLLVIRKVNHTPLKYPRKAGSAVKAPIK